MRRFYALVMPAGIVAAVVAAGVAHAHLAATPYPYGGSRLWWGLIFAGLLWVAAYAFGLPDVPRVPRQAMGAAAGTAVVGPLALAAVQAAVGVQILPRFVLVAGTAGAAAWVAVTSMASLRARRRRQEGDRVLLVAGSEAAGQLVAELSGLPHPPVLAAVVEPAAGRPAPGSATPLLDLAEDTSATIVVLDREAQLDQTLVDQVALLHERGMRVRTLSLFYEEWLLRLPVSELERVSLMFDIGEVHRARYGRRKRILDVVVSIGAVPVLLGVTPLIWLGNRLGNRGPLFFRQPRVGKHGRVFQIVKFRTMRDTPDGAGRWTSGDDPRVTPFGAFLRRSHLDELPQVVNVLRGELSIVGPRPEQPHYVRELAAKLPFYDLRHLVQPGLTGWAQIHQGYAASEGDALEKLQYEFWYLRHQSLALDLRITARTVRTIAWGVGR